MFDFAPLYRSTVGFDRLFNMLDNLPSGDSSQTYPPYNIERLGDNEYRITMAVAGFGEDDLNIEVKEQALTVTGKRPENTDSEGQVLHQGIAGRAFERRFHLADHVEVSGAALKNGLLHIDLKREIPEALKPRTIAITNGGGKKQIEGKKAA